MREVEDRLRIAVPERLKRKGETALDRLSAVAGRGGGDATLVVALLEFAADAAERHSTIGTLPSGERDRWTAVGAKFDTRARRGNDQRLIDALAALLARSVIGDAAMAELLGVDRTRVSQRLSDRSLYAFTAGDERCFPRWQIVDTKLLPGLKAVLRAIDPALHPLTVDHWFRTSNVDLEIDDEPVSPASWLATGGAPQTAVALAADL